jgi:hypothetical protein
VPAVAVASDAYNTISPELGGGGAGGGGGGGGGGGSDVPVSGRITVSFFAAPGAVVRYVDAERTI